MKCNLPAYSTAIQPGDLFRFYKIHFQSIPPLSIESIPENLAPFVASFKGQLDTEIIEIIIGDNILSKIASDMIEKQLNPVSFFKLITDERPTNKDLTVENFEILEILRQCFSDLDNKSIYEILPQLKSALEEIGVKTILSQEEKRKIDNLKKFSNITDDLTNKIVQNENLFNVIILLIERNINPKILIEGILNANIYTQTPISKT